MGIEKEPRRLGTWLWSLPAAAICLVLAWLILNGGAATALAGDLPPSESKYVEVIPGELPLIIAIPHGGEASPESIPTRQQAVLHNDWSSQSAGRELAAALQSITGYRPMLVINHLDRAKLDPNRSLAHGAQGDPTAEAAWQSYHGAINEGAQRIGLRCSRGLFLDLHSYGGDARLIQIGYGLDPDSLAEDDENLSKRRFIYDSNIRALPLTTGISLAELVRGESSLGSRLQQAGYQAVPSPARPEGFDGYFDGGYSVYLHGSQQGGVVDGVQLELPYGLLEEPYRARLVTSLAEALVDHLADFYQLDRSGQLDFPCSAFVDVPPSHWASSAVNQQFRAGLASPCAGSPRHFCPEQEITRGEAVVWLWQALNQRHEFGNDGWTVFADIGPNASAVRTLWQQDIIEACDTQPLRFCPEAPLTRVQLASWLLRAGSGPALVPSTPSANFADVDQYDWGGWWVEDAYRAGLIRRCAEQPTARLCPHQPVTRAEWAWAIQQSLPEFTEPK